MFGTLFNASSVADLEGGWGVRVKPPLSQDYFFFVCNFKEFHVELTNARSSPDLFCGYLFCGYLFCGYLFEPTTYKIMNWL